MSTQDRRIGMAGLGGVCVVRRLLIASGLLASVVVSGPQGLAWAGAGSGTFATADDRASAKAADTLIDTLKGLTAQEQAYFQHVTALSSPFFEGRAPGERGNELAAEYAEFFFKRAGLRPVIPQEGGQPTYRQPFDMAPRLTLEDKSLAWSIPGGATVSLGPAQFTPLGATGSTPGQEPAQLPMVFAGYGLETSEQYHGLPADLDLSGKLVVVFRFEPLNERGQSRLGQDGQFTRSAGLAQKFEALTKRGAAGIVVVNPPGLDDPRAGRLDRFQAAAGGRTLGVPVLQMTEDAFDALAVAAGTSIKDLRAQADAGHVLADLKAVASVKVKATSKPVKTGNVAGLVQGRGALASEYVVVGGHYDHVGYGFFGSRGGFVGQLHPGADDNASGTAGVLLAAERMARQYAELPESAQARSLIFVVFSAEESGLVGAREFVRALPVPADKVYAMLNMDMIGRVRKGIVDVAGIGSAKGFADILAPHFERSGLNVAQLPGAQGPSDHAVFYGAQVPSLHFFSGIHPQYHQPGDTYVHINPVGAVRVIDMVMGIAQDLATRAQPLEFTQATGQSVDLRADRWDDAPAAPAAPAQGQGAQAVPGAGGGAGGLSGTAVRFGIAPGNYGQSGGVLVGDVTPGGTAEKAGLVAGDLITHWDSRPIESVEAWVPMLAAATPGQVVSLTVKRGQRVLTVPATLQARPAGE